MCCVCAVSAVVVVNVDRCRGCTWASMPMKYSHRMRCVWTCYNRMVMQCATEHTGNSSSACQAAIPLPILQWNWWWSANICGPGSFSFILSLSLALSGSFWLSASSFGPCASLAICETYYRWWLEYFIKWLCLWPQIRYRLSVSYSEWRTIHTHTHTHSTRCRYYFICNAKYISMRWKAYHNTMHNFCHYVSFDGRQFCMCVCRLCWPSQHTFHVHVRFHIALQPHAIADQLPEYYYYFI